jgi:hypothetical protein
MTDNDEIYEPTMRLRFVSRKVAINRERLILQQLWVPKAEYKFNDDDWRDVPVMEEQKP